MVQVRKDDDRVGLDSDCFTIDSTQTHGIAARVFSSA